jgi:hypothetical protein
VARFKDCTSYANVRNNTWLEMVFRGANPKGRREHIIELEGKSQNAVMLSQGISI